MDEFKKLVTYFKKLPGVGPRQATRFVLYLMNKSSQELEEFGDAISRLKYGVRLCNTCFNIAESELCPICLDSKRDTNTICVVEKITDAESIEKTGQFKGVYHVLGGVINPSDKVLPNNLKIKELFKRVTQDTEIIIATNPGVYGETTALYLEEELKPLGAKTSRLGRGLASGTALEFADDSTLINALKNRK